ncbi:MAG: 4'-phosphopantetheinyl transferase family protein [Methylococcales bacterium]
MTSGSVFRPPRFGRDSFELSHGLIHVWDGIGSIEATRYRCFYEILDDAERQRAERFRAEQHKIRFVTCRGWLRLLLSAYTGLHPGDIPLTPGEHGKPRLNDNPPNTGLVFNVSHSGERMVFAFGLDCMLGVDIERFRDIPRLESLVDRICSEPEKNTWLNLPAERRAQVFFAIWVRKEAIIKAHGQGVSLGMPDCALSNDLERPVSLPESCGNVEDWTVLGLDYPEDYSGAIAVGSPLGSMVRQALPEQQLLNLYLSRELG